LLCCHVFIDFARKDALKMTYGSSHKNISEILGYFSGYKATVDSIKAYPCENKGSVVLKIEKIS